VKEDDGAKGSDVHMRKRNTNVIPDRHLRRILYAHVLGHAEI
jgi:hypothetical protein